MWWIKFSLLMAAQILVIVLVPNSIGESPWMLALLIIWGFAAWFVTIISSIARLTEIRNPDEKGLHFTISFTWKTISLSAIIPGGLFAVTAVSLWGQVPLIIPVALLTFVLSPVAGTILLDRAKPFCKIAFVSMVSFVLLILISGWAWAYTIDNRVEHFFGEGTVLAEIADERLRTPQGNLIFDPDPGAWQIANVFSSKGYRYCARLQFYTWMRIPTRVWTNCFGSVLLEASFVPGEPNGPIRPQDRVFRASGASSETELQGLNWQGGALTLTLDPYFPLTSLALEFIDGGDIILTLFPSDAATDSEAGTLTWAVPEQPWQDGDSLTFRIRAQRLPGDPAGP